MSRHDHRTDQIMKLQEDEISGVYTVIVREKVFKLSKSQIQRDSPNFFTSYFLDSSGETVAHSLEISRDPHLFELVLRYLNGYRVLPIHFALQPPYSTPETALADLRVDAEFYQLDGLLSLCAASEATAPTIPQPTTVASLPTTRFAAITGYFNVFPGERVPSEDFNDFIPRFSMCFLSDDRYSVASAGMYTLYNAVPSMAHHFVGVAGWSERINVRAVVQRDTSSVERWELLGWKREMLQPGLRQSIIFVQLWVGPEFKLKH